MDTIQQTEVNEISFASADGSMIAIAVESGLQELNMGELDGVSGCGGHQSNSHFDRHRSETKGSSFAGPEGAGSTFSHKEETISAGNSDFSWD